MKKLLALLMVFLVAVSPFKAAEAKTHTDNIIYLSGGSSELYKKQLAITHQQMGTLAPAYFYLDSNGNLVSYVDQSFVDDARRQGYKVTPFLTNHWNYDLAVKAMDNRKNLARQIAEAVKKHHLDGVNIDIENLSEKERDQQTEFLKMLADELHPLGKILSVAVAPAQSDSAKGWMGAFDFEEIGKIADTVFIMAYEQHYEGGATPGPQAGYEWTRATVNYLTKKIPAEKLVLGLALYGRYWTDGIKGKAITYSEAQRMMKENQAEWRWDEKYQASYASYTDHKTGKKVDIWIDHADSLKKKISIAKEFGLKSWGAWKLGQEDPTLWSQLEGNPEEKTEVKPNPQPEVKPDLGKEIADQAKKSIRSKVTKGSSEWVSYIYKKKGQNIPGKLSDLSRKGEKVQDQKNLLPGDVVLLGSGSNKLIAAGIYTGGGKIVLSYKPFGKIKELSLSSSQIKKYYVGARRLIKE